MAWAAAACLVRPAQTCGSGDLGGCLSRNVLDRGRVGQTQHGFATAKFCVFYPPDDRRFRRYGWSSLFRGTAVTRFRPEPQGPAAERIARKGQKDLVDQLADRFADAGCAE